MLFIAANFLNAEEGVLAPILGTLDINSETEYCIWLECFLWGKKKSLYLIVLTWYKNKNELQMRMAREEQTVDGKLISKKISEENEHDTVQSFDEINTYLQNTLISTNWHSLQHFFFFPRDIYPTSVAYCGSIIMSDLNGPNMLSSQENHLKSDMTQNFN